VKAAGVRYLFVSSLFHNERVNIRHSWCGFVTESQWATKQPSVFELRFANSAARIYEMNAEAVPGPRSPRVTRREIDAVELYVTDAEATQRLYPRAAAFLRGSRVLDYARRRAKSAP
jgi:hypothetical protein